MSDTKADTSRGLGSRRLALVVGFAVLFGVPLVRQILDYHSPYLWRWTLYHGHGSEVCGFQLTRVGENTSVPLDRAELLEVDSLYKLKARDRTVKSKRLAKHVESLCAKATEQWGPGVDLRIEGRCDATSGWLEVGDPELNVCSGPGRQVLRQSIADVNAAKKKVRQEQAKRNKYKPTPKPKAGGAKGGAGK